MITKGERTELRSLIRQRFKVLRADVAAREAELVSELEQKVTDHFAADDKAWADVDFLIDEAVREANRKANDAVRALVGRDGWPRDGRIVRSCTLSEVRLDGRGDTCLATLAQHGEIPTVSSLVPADRLLELERSLSDGAA